VAEVQVYDLALADWTVQGVYLDGNIEVPARVPGTFFLRTWSVIKLTFILLYHKVHKYLEYHSVCPLVRIGTHPLFSKCVSLPPESKGGTHSPAGEGVGGPNSDDWR
jgi:hypothetical protein